MHFKEEKMTYKRLTINSKKNNLKPYAYMLKM